MDLNKETATTEASGERATRKEEEEEEGWVGAREMFSKSLGSSLSL